jgi:DNA-binding IclR family transcriptional regulator
MGNKRVIHSTTLADVRVLEALAGDDFRPRTTNELADELKLKYEAVHAALVTWRAAEYVRKNGSRWEITARLVMFAKRRTDGE